MDNNLRDNIKKVLDKYEVQQVKGKTVEQIYIECIQFILSNIKIPATDTSCYILKETIKEKIDLDITLQIKNQEGEMTVEDILLLCNCYHFSADENGLGIVFWKVLGAEFIEEFNEKYDFVLNTIKGIKSCYREKIELECLAYTHPTMRNKAIISKIKNIDILKEWLLCGFELEEFRLLENSGANMQLAFEVKKINHITGDKEN